jgi:hypothetical protein
MAAWLKVCKDTPEKRELGLVGELTQLSQAEVFLHWFHLYSWADEQTSDGFIPHFSLALLSRTSGVPMHVCQAFASPVVGWLVEGYTRRGDTGVMFANYDRHNGKSAKKRSVDAKRQGENRRK